VKELVPSSQRDKVEPTDEEIIFYGKIIGLDFENEDIHLKWIGKYAIKADLPREWRAFKTSDGIIVYQNLHT